jgi:hypothetical protein
MKSLRFLLHFAAHWTLLGTAQPLLDAGGVESMGAL